MVKFLKNNLFFYVFCLFFTVNGMAVTRKTAQSGSWKAASTWSPTGVPGCGDSVVIQSGHDVEITDQQDYTGCSNPSKVVVLGKLIFTHGYKLQLRCNSYVLVKFGGLIQADVGGGNSNYIEICNNIEWNSATGSILGMACFPLGNPLCSSAFALPIELNYFKAESCKYHEVCFNWETATEINNNHYEVQRSEDGRDFNTILALNSKAPSGNSHYNISYSGTDQSPINGINYYRLKQVDNDNTSNYSNTISVQLFAEENLQFLVFPNYNSGEFTAKITGLKNSENISVLLRDARGSIVYKAFHHVDEDLSAIKVVPQDKLEDGIYFCSFIMDDIDHVVKIIVKK